MNTFEVVKTGHTLNNDFVKVRDWVEGCKNYSMDKTHKQFCVDYMIEQSYKNTHVLVVSDWMGQVSFFTNELTNLEREFSAITSKTRDRELVLSKWQTKGGLLILSKSTMADSAFKFPPELMVIITSPIKAGVTYGKIKASKNGEIKYVYSDGSKVGSFALRESLRVAALCDYKFNEETSKVITQMKAYPTIGRKTLATVELKERDADLTYFRLSEIKDRTDEVISRIKTDLIPVNNKFVVYCHSKDQANYVLSELADSVKTYSCVEQDTVKEKAALVDFHFSRQKSVLAVTLPRLVSAITSGLHADSIVFASPPPDTITMNRRLYDKDTPSQFILFKDKGVGASEEAEQILKTFVKETQK